MKSRMLLVDDQAPILAPLAEYFTSLGWQVSVTQEFEEAAALLEDTPFDLLLADIRLGGTHSHEGLQLLAKVRARGLPTRVVLMTAYGSPLIHAEAERLGADAILLKPVPLSTLAAAAGPPPASI
jgi:DNA-binding response OmpR family regulator